MIEQQADRNLPEREINVTFDGTLLVGAKVQVHGGVPQRTPSGPVGAAGSCSNSAWSPRYSSDGLPACKPGLRLNFNKHSKLGNQPRLWGHPATLAGCSAPDKLVLRSVSQTRLATYGWPRMDLLRAQNKGAADVGKFGCRRNGTTASRCFATSCPTTSTTKSARRLFAWSTPGSVSLALISVCSLWKSE